jgi:hypothetical protein
MTKIGKVLFAHDNGAAFFEQAPRGVLCWKCKTCLDCDYHPRDLEINTFYDFSSTLDNRLICSKRAHEFLVSAFIVASFLVGKWRGHPLFHVVPETRVPFDAITRGTRFLDQCGVCGNYGSIVGCSPAHLVLPSLPKECCVRTDIMFGSNEEKCSLTIVGIATAVQMEDLGFSGMIFEDALSSG